MKNKIKNKQCIESKELSKANKFKDEKAITLIALVITIIVLLILAAISIGAIFGENGLLNKARQAAIKNAQAAKEEEVGLAITEVLVGNNYNKDQVTISEVLEKVKKNYDKQKDLDAITGESTGGTENKFPGIIQYENPASTVDVTIIVEVDENLNVTSRTDEPVPPEPETQVDIPESEYKKTGETYYYTPDMIKFNPKNTYYITYDEEGNNETVYGRLDKVEEPSDWYNYENKVWANLATVNGVNVTYWTWIPRYMYKIGEEEKTSQMVDIKFVDANNKYEGKETVDLSQYKLPESFTFAEERLKGYWVSKYEIQDNQSNVTEFPFVNEENNTLIVSTTNPSGTYTLLIDGKEYKGGLTLPYTIDDVNMQTDHEILVVSEEQGRIIGNTKVNRTSKNIKVDTSGFDKAHTYYITYDENGTNEKVYGRMDKVQEPENWYNYDKKIWANLVTIDENGDDVTYWTYIPRYEYITYPKSEFVEINYIPSSQVTADAGEYKIPESFTFGEENLNGYWVSKYEIQDAITNITEKVMAKEEDGKINVTTNNPKGTYTILVDGVKHIEGVELPYNIEDMESSKVQEISVFNETEGKMIGSSKVNRTSKNIEIDLRGFNPSCTRYVTYDENGENEQIGDNIQVDANGKPTNPPKNWYNYDKKIWANIVTENEGQITYWTYIPRYEYIAYSKSEYTDIRYIPSTQTTADADYKIPESFKFADKELKGYWVTKYEIQNK